MFGSTFYHSLTRKYVTYFGTLFNDITISRTAANNVQQVIKVPLSYSPVNKMIERINQFATLDDEREIAVQLPRMGFEMISMSYDANRHLNTTNRNVLINSDGTADADFQYVPVPYNLSFLLSIYVKNTEDGSKIVEQILPYFAPDWTETLMLIPELPIPYDIPVQIRDVSLRDNYEGNPIANRYMIWSITFEMRAWFFAATRRRGVIKQVITQIFMPGQDQTITIRPGLTANGTPTSDALQSIPYLDIEANDPYGFVINVDDSDIINQLIPPQILMQFELPNEPDS